ncbi:MAG TPA: BREX-2 system adenine-specific DNA-methyltransferase PglX, partial [Polyangiaceae bacterium]|nr:BREX-2 system adenine-specific DNA-methyltransferase PglX [Polyangiaceae bacterium]
MTATSLNPSPPDPLRGALPKLLQPALKALEKDLLARAKTERVEAGLKAAWEDEQRAGQTGLGFEPWRRERVTQLAVAWTLSVVFVRTLEDRGYIDPRVAGASLDALRAAEDRETLFTQVAPALGPREYLLAVFRELSKLPGARDVFDTKHNPIWVLSPSNQGAKALLDFFRKRDASGAPALAFTGENTRFLGDLYQNLSEAVRKRYALLQTPEFVEEFILDQTLDPAIAEFGLEDVTLIDPTCGSGHFLLGAFRRLLGRWQKETPTEHVADLARRALDQVTGVDINPYAVAIARFRLVLALLDAVGIKRLEKAPDIKPNVVVADSLLHRFDQRVLNVGQTSMDDDLRWGDRLFRLENRSEVERVLSRRYQAVVGNPPYITEKDKGKRKKYRDMYKSAAGKYALAAPFTERFFDLAADNGFVGQINSNAWTKRGYGKTLVEKILPGVDVQKVIDTSGSYLPGHGTPTLLLFGRNRAPADVPIVAVLGKRGEQKEPAEGLESQAPVWSEIVAHHDQVGFDGVHVSVESISRPELSRQPWILAGGGARALYTLLRTKAPHALKAIASQVGYASFPGMNDAFLMPPTAARNAGVPEPFIRSFIAGEAVRDWMFESSAAAIAAYDDEHKLVPLKSLERGARHFWALRTTILSTTDFGGETRGESGDPYWGWYRWQQARYAASLRIAFPYVSTHNHFAIDRGGRVFNQHAPIILLKSNRGTLDYQALSAYANSSTAAFWCRLVMFPKGGDQVGEGARLSKTPWQDRLEYAGNLLKQLPVPTLEDLRTTLLDVVI